MTTALAFIFVLGVLIFIHELGHFLLAKKVGIFVERFSIGFPPYIFSRKKGDTTYSIGLIPLGGFVKMKGENPDEESSGDADEFMSKTVGQRAAVIFAGPFMNYVLAIVLMIGVFYFSGQPIFDETRIVVGAVSEGGPAAQAGLKTGDQIVAIDGHPVIAFDTLKAMVGAKLAEPVKLTWLSGGDTLQKMITTEIVEVPNAQGGVDSTGKLQFNQQVLRYESIGVLESVERGFISAHVLVYKTVEFVGMLVSGQVSAKLLGGPLFIAQQSGKQAEEGASSLFMFMALLSVNLAVLNILPIPILDGGHLVFLAIEAIKGSPLSTKARGVAQQVGLVVLLSLILFVTYNDILRFFKG